MVWKWTKDGLGRLLGNGSITCPTCKKEWSGNHTFFMGNLPMCETKGN